MKTPEIAKLEIIAVRTCWVEVPAVAEVSALAEESAIFCLLTGKKLILGGKVG